MYFSLNDWYSRAAISTHSEEDPPRSFLTSPEPRPRVPPVGSPGPPCTTLPAASIARRPTRARFSTMLPIPISAPSSISHPSSKERCPTVTFWPMVVGRLFVGVDHAVVLDAGPGTDDDPVEVPPQDRPEPDARPVLDRHVPDEHRGRRDERAGMHARLRALERNDMGHSLSPPEPGRAPLAGGPHAFLVIFRGDEQALRQALREEAALQVHASQTGGAAAWTGRRPAAPS